MILALLIAAADPPSQDVTIRLAEARHAIEAGRLEQARLMIAHAVAGGADGRAIDRLAADLAFASARYAEAVTRYESLAAAGATDTLLLERTGVAALKAGDLPRARQWVDRAAQQPDASWQAWNAQGVIADLDKDFARADAAYGKASRLAPGEAEIVNNSGWSKLLRGEWAEALAILERAAALDPKSPRIRNNLELARAALSDDLPRRHTDESDEAWAARLNDAGVAARMRGQDGKAVAAFTRAIEVRSSWFERAANNLKLTQAQR